MDNEENQDDIPPEEESTEIDQFQQNGDNVGTTDVEEQTTVNQDSDQLKEEIEVTDSQMVEEEKVQQPVVDVSEQSLDILQDSSKTNDHTEELLPTEISVDQTHDKITESVNAKILDAEDEKTSDENSSIPKEIPSATVKIVLLPSAQVATMKCALNQTLQELKHHFAMELKIPVGVILLMHEEELAFTKGPEDDSLSMESEMSISFAIDTHDTPQPTILTPIADEIEHFNEYPQVLQTAVNKEDAIKYLLDKLTSSTNEYLSSYDFDKRVNGNNMEDTKTLADLGVGPNGTVQLEMQSADPINTPIKAFKPRQEYVMPDVITVRVETEPQRFKDIVVEVERSPIKKPFLGGFKHKQTGVEYHNASAQTGQKAKPMSNVERYCRDTQTYEMRHRRQQTSEDRSTQMTKIGVYVSNMPDKLMVPGKYTTADQKNRAKLKSVIILQKYWRRWLAKKYVDRLKEDMQKRLEWEKLEEIKKREEKELRIKKEFERRMNPKTKEDFDLLYAALEKWRIEELERIDQSLSGAERKAALCQLLDQETQLITSIGRHKQDADTEMKQKTIQSFLDKASAPKKWKGPDGCYTEMDTPYTIRAQELRDIYNSICMKYLTQDERLDVLLTLKHTVKEHDCKLTQDIIELIDREADLLMRGVKDTNLEGLRKRIATLFLQYIKTPTFNPEAARLLKVPQDPTQLRQNIYYCSSCKRYLPSLEFQLSTNSRTVGRCRQCRNLDNDARTRHDYSHYRLMLRDLRRIEESYGDDSKVAFLLQENDLRYLVENIWGSKSIISSWDDLYDLILVRWDKHKEWSPWNCVLVTREESSAHERLEALDEGYGKELVHKVQRKHALARNYFSRLPGMSEHMRNKVAEPPNAPKVEGIAVK